MKMKLSTQEKSEFRLDRAQFEGTLDFFADLNVAVAIPESGSEQDTVMVAVWAEKQPMSKTYAMNEALRIFLQEGWRMFAVLRKDREDSEIARDIAEVFSLVEPESLSDEMIRDAVSDSRQGDRWSFDR
jgi:hypothetical protein